MNTVLNPLFFTLIGLLRSTAMLSLENLALRQQLAVAADRDRKRIWFRRRERLFWALLYRCWPGCLETLQVSNPIRWSAGTVEDFDDSGAGNLFVAEADDRKLILKSVS